MCIKKDNKRLSYMHARSVFWRLYYYIYIFFFMTTSSDAIKSQNTKVDLNITVPKIENKLTRVRSLSCVHGIRTRQKSFLNKTFPPTVETWGDWIPSFVSNCVLFSCLCVRLRSKYDYRHRCNSYEWSGSVRRTHNSGTVLPTYIVARPMHSNAIRLLKTDLNSLRVVVGLSPLKTIDIPEFSI